MVLGLIVWSFMSGVDDSISILAVQQRIALLIGGAPLHHFSSPPVPLAVSRESGGRSSIPATAEGFALGPCFLEMERSKPETPIRSPSFSPFL